MSDDLITAEQAQALLDDSLYRVVASIGIYRQLANMVIAQADEITRLRAKVEAAEKLAEALRGIKVKIEVSEVWWMDVPERGGFDVGEIENTLSAYEEAGK